MRWKLKLTVNLSLIKLKEWLYENHIRAEEGINRRSLFFINYHNNVIMKIEVFYFHT